jgi:hypothetical protein
MPKWKQGIPNEDGYYWVYDNIYDLCWFVQRIRGEYVWFSDTGVDKMAPSNGINNFSKEGKLLWWYKIREPKPFWKLSKARKDYAKRDI